MSTTQFGKVLIANRGEIACRIMRTCKRMGVRTVAVYSDADAGSLHVRLADEAVHIGSSAASESYLDIDRVIAAAQRTGADAIHPGYGFLSENAEFAEACADAGIVFIGPPASAIRAMGSKAAAKALMQGADVPLTPGYHGNDQSPAFLAEQAQSIGFPVLIKATAGGGGKGMRRVDSADDFSTALASCKREAAASFGDDRMLIEKYILRPRHIEIQVFADTHGNIVSLFERDCSVQRRHQKVLEEAPAPGMTADRRAAMNKAACDAARTVGYVGAGTVEFIVDANGSFHFMEMNTRLQVEHPVTEMVTGLDLVEWQLKVAAGQPLPLTQEQLRISGHAIEARIYAEDPSHDFLPSIGQLVHLNTPDVSPHVRIDSGIEQGDKITAFYDPMVAKLIVWNETRELALATMERSLAAFQVAGVQSNIAFLRRLVATPSFVNADLDTSLIDREKDHLFPAQISVSPEAYVFATLFQMQVEKLQQRESGASPWAATDGWRLNADFRRTLHFTSPEDREGAVTAVAVDYTLNAYSMLVLGQQYTVSDVDVSGTDVAATMSGVRQRASVVDVKSAYHVFFAGKHYIFAYVDPLAVSHVGTKQEASLLAPMPGLLTMHLVQPGEHVEAGAPLLVLEAMKMEYTIKAPTPGHVETFLFAPGDQVTEGTQLVQFVRDVETGSAPA